MSTDIKDIKRLIVLTYLDTLGAQSMRAGKEFRLSAVLIKDV